MCLTAASASLTNTLTLASRSLRCVRSSSHHHADHNTEYGPLLVVGWINGMHLDVRPFGPPPLKQMTEDFLRAYKTTIDFWTDDLKTKPLVNAGLADPKLKDRIFDLGGSPLVLSPAEFGKLIADETEKWAKVVKFSGAKLD